MEIKVFDSEGNPYGQHELTITGETLQESKVVETDSKGEVMEYFPKGEYTVFIRNWDNHGYIMDVADLTDGACEVTLRQTKQPVKQPVYIKAFGIDKAPLAGAKISITGGTLEKELCVVTGQNGKVRVDLLDGKYKVSMMDWNEEDVIVEELTVSGKVAEVSMTQTKKEVCDVRFTVLDKDGNPVRSAKVQYDDIEGRTSLNGMVTLHMKNGEHIVNITDRDGKEKIIKKKVVVNGKDLEITIKTNWEGKEQEVFDENAHGNVSKSGTCGENVSWKLYEDGMLYIYGEGDIKFNSFEGFNIKKVWIERGVTSIGNESFIDCSNLTSIELPTGVTSIGEWAFFGCNNLTIYAPSGSYAQSYAEEHSIPFIATDMVKAASLPGTSYAKVNVSKLSNNKTKSANAKTVTRQKVLAGEEYTLLVVKDKDAKELLSPENLLYIAQQTADNSGSITFTYLPKEITAVGTELVLGAVACDMTKLENVIHDCEQGVYTESSMYQTKEDLKYAIRLLHGMLQPNSQEEVNILTAKLEETLEIFVPVSFKIGDVDHNDKINANDALMVLKIAANLLTPTEEQKTAADVDGNGTEDASDALLVLKYAAGLISEFPSAA